MKNIVKKMLGALIAVCAFLALSTTAFAADGDLVSMTLKDLNDPVGTVGKIDSIDVVVAYANAAGSGAVCTGIANATSYETTLTKWTATGTGDVTVGGIDWVSGEAGVSCTFRVKVLDGDTDLAFDTSATALDVVYDGSGGDLRVQDALENTANVATILTGATEADGAAPTVKTFTFQDNDSNGKIDQFLVTFTETVTAASVLSANDLNMTEVGDFTGAAFGTSGTDLIAGSVASITVVLGTESTAIDTGQSQAMTILSQNAFSLTDGTNTNNTPGLLTTGPTSVVDGAAPVYMSSATLDNNADGTVDFVKVNYSEPISDASVALGDYKAYITTDDAGSLTESFTSLTPATGVETDTANDATIFVGVASGTETITANKTDYLLKIVQIAAVTDAMANSLASFTVQTSIDSAGPVYVSSQTLDNDNNGTVDYIKITYSEAVLDSSVAGTDYKAYITTDADGSLTEAYTSLTPSSGNVTDTLNDAYIYVGVTSGTETISTNKTDYTLKIVQIGAITDAVPNSLASFTVQTSTDNAAPIVVSVSQNVGGVKNILTITYSEPMQYNPDGGATWYTTANEVTGRPSTTTLGAMTTAGTVAGFGSWAGGTVGNVANSAATNNSIDMQAGDATISVVFNEDGYYTSASTTAPAANNTFTPASASSYIKEQATAGLGVNTSKTVSSAPTISTAWDLTKPTILSAVLTDTYINASTTNAGHDGKVDLLTLTASETLKTVANSADTRSDWTVTSNSTEYGSSLTVTSASAAGSAATYVIIFSGANIFYDTATLTVAAAEDEWSLMDLAGNIFAPTSKICMNGYACTGGTGNYAVTTLSIEKPGATDSTPPAKPTGLAAAMTSEGAVKLTWTGPTNTDLSYTSVLKAKNGQAMTGTAIANVAKGTYTYTDTDVVAGDVVRYALKAVDTGTNASGLTDVVEITVVVPEEEEAAEGEEVTEEGEATVEEEAAEGEEVTEEEPNGGVAIAEPEPVTQVTVNEVVKVFEDVKGAEWAVPAVTSLYNRGIIKGKTEGKFAPADNLNRAETAAMLYRVFGLGEPSAPSKNPFTDVSGSDWFAGYVAKLKADGIIKGNPDGTYAPAKEINRAEFLTFLMRVYEARATEEELKELNGLSVTTTHYADLTANWYTATVAKATQLGIVEGSKIGGKYYFNADTTINRAEAAQMIYKAFYESEDEVSHMLSKGYASVTGNLPTILPAIVVFLSIGSVVGFIRLRKKA